MEQNICSSGYFGKEFFDKGQRFQAREANFYLIRPPLVGIDYADRLGRFKGAFKVTDFPTSAEEIEWRVKQLLDEIGENKSIADLVNKVCLPTILPKLNNFFDYGEVLELKFLTALRNAYEEEFPERKFQNWQENNLAGEIKIIKEVRDRQEELLAKMMQHYLVVLYFPNALQKLPILYIRKQAVTFPRSIILSGGFEFTSAMVMWSDVLGRDWLTPGYDISAISWRSPFYTLLCKESMSGEVKGMVLDSRSFLCHKHPGHSSGLIFIGEASTI